MNYEVKTISYEECKEWLLYKHYARRMCSISYSFGLFDGVECVGVCTFGKPASPSLCVGVCGEELSNKVYELNRLCVNEGLPRNTLSIFVSKCLKYLPSLVIVSYADKAQGHNGYIYQATNWIYTGATKERTDIGSEDGTHSRHYTKGDAKNRKKRSSKHRYIYFTGGKKERKTFKSKLRYKQEPYPKGENKRYKADFKPNTQTKLF